MTVTEKSDTRPTVTHPVELVAGDAALAASGDGMQAANRAYYVTVIPAMMGWVRNEMAAKTLPTEMAVTLSYFARELEQVVSPRLPIRQATGQATEKAAGQVVSQGGVGYPIPATEAGVGDK